MTVTVPSSIMRRQDPKSARRIWPLTSSRTLSGLMSLKDEKHIQLVIVTFIPDRSHGQLMPQQDLINHTQYKDGWRYCAVNPLVHFR